MRVVNEKARASFSRTKFLFGSDTRPHVKDLIKSTPGYSVFCTLVDTFQKNSAAPDDYWLVGSALYLPMCTDTVANAADWNILFSSFRDSQIPHPSMLNQENWQLSLNSFNGMEVSLDGTSVDLINGAFLYAMNPEEAVHPVTDWLMSSPISTWAVAAESDLSRTYCVPTFHDALARRSIEVNNVTSFLHFVGRNLASFTDKIVKTAVNANLMADGEVLAMLNLTANQFRQMVESAKNSSSDA
jgi:hypothetical protein